MGETVKVGKVCKLIDYDYPFSPLAMIESFIDLSTMMTLTMNHEISSITHYHHDSPHPQRLRVRLRIHRHKTNTHHR